MVLPTDFSNDKCGPSVNKNNITSENNNVKRKE
jgi:hypothetical protein